MSPLRAPAWMDAAGPDRTTRGCGPVAKVVHTIRIPFPYATNYGKACKSQLLWEALLSGRGKVGVGHWGDVRC